VDLGWMTTAKAAKALPIFGVLLLGGLARFAGLEMGLRHPVHASERAYVESVVGMVEAGRLDHGFHGDPALFYYLLAPGVWLLGPDRWHGPDAYLASRVVVAAVGTLNCLLIYLIGRRLVGSVAGIAAAALLAVSPLDVRACHGVRPEVLLLTFGILALPLLARATLPEPPDLRAGALIGLAAAVKLAGAFLWPSYLLARLGPRPSAPRRLMVAGVLSVAVVLALSPALILHPAGSWQGLSRQMTVYYQGHFGSRMPANLEVYAAALTGALGWVAVGACALGMTVLVRRQPRLWSAMLVYPALVIVANSTAVLAFPRLVLPAMAPLYLASGAGIAWIIDRPLVMRRKGAVLIVLLGALLWMPAGATLRFVQGAMRPSIADRALDWIQSSVRQPSLFLESRREAGPDARPGMMLGIAWPHEVVYLDARDNPWALRRLALDVDFVITGPAGGRWTRGLPPMIDLFAVGAGPDGIRIRRLQARSRYVDLDAELSEPTGELEVVKRGDWWDDWPGQPVPLPKQMTLTFAQPGVVSRIDLLGVLGSQTPRLSVQGPEGEIRWVLGRPPLDEQMGPKSLPILLEPTLADKLRIVSRRRDDVMLSGVAIMGPAPDPAQGFLAPNR
jgi:hypothetical protein